MPRVGSVIALAMGSNEGPIEIALTSDQSGALHGFSGNLEDAHEGEVYEALVTRENSLVKETSASPEAKGCGVRGEADEAVNSKLACRRRLARTAPGSRALIDLTLASWMKERFLNGERVTKAGSTRWSSRVGSVLMQS